MGIVYGFILIVGLLLFVVFILIFLNFIDVSVVS